MGRLSHLQQSPDRRRVFSEDFLKGFQVGGRGGWDEEKRFSKCFSNSFVGFSKHVVVDFC